MKHAILQEMLARRAELSLQEELQVQQHLESCAECRQRASDYARQTALLRSLPIVEPPASLRSGVMRRIQEPAKPTPFWVRRPFLAFPLAAAAIIVFAVALSMYQKPHQPNAGGRTSPLTPAPTARSDLHTNIPATKVPAPSKPTALRPTHGVPATRPAKTAAPRHAVTPARQSGRSRATTVPTSAPLPPPAGSTYAAPLANQPAPIPTSTPLPVTGPIVISQRLEPTPVRRVPQRAGPTVSRNQGNPNPTQPSSPHPPTPPRTGGGSPAGGKGSHPSAGATRTIPTTAPTAVIGVAAAQRPTSTPTTGPISVAGIRPTAAPPAPAPTAPAVPQPTPAPVRTPLPVFGAAPPHVTPPPIPSPTPSTPPTPAPAYEPVAGAAPAPPEVLRPPVPLPTATAIP